MSYDPYAFDGFAAAANVLGVDREAHPLSLEHPRPPRRASVRKWHARWNASCPCGWRMWEFTHGGALNQLEKHLRYHRAWFELNNVPLIGRVAGYRDGLEIGLKGET